MSYAGELKAAILQDEPKDICCARSTLLGIFLPSAYLADGEVLVHLAGASVCDYVGKLVEKVYHTQARVETRRGGGGARHIVFSSRAAVKLIAGADEPHFSPADHFKCPVCGQYFLRGLFLACGYACDPETELRLEWAPLLRASQVNAYLTSIDLPPLHTERGGKTILFYRSGPALMDLLGRMQLLDAMYALSDILIIRDLKNQETRSTNCIVKNLRSSSDARTEQLRVIRRLKEKNLLSNLSDDLRRTAELLLDNSDDSLSQLAMKSVPPLTKSGVYHRLLKIMQLSKEMNV